MNAKPKILYHGSGIEITDGFIRVKPAHINHMQTPIVAVFATSDLVHAKNYAIMRLVGEGWKSPRERDVLYVQRLKPNIPGKAFVYELDSDGFQQDVDGNYYCLTDKKIKNVIDMDIMQEIRDGNLKVYVLKDEFNIQNMSGKAWEEIIKDKSKFELYKPDSKKLEMQILAQTLTNGTNTL